MMINTSAGIPISEDLLRNYFKALVNRFYKILPMKEEQQKSLPLFIESMQRELLGCKSLINVISDDPMYLSLLSILQWFIDNEDYDVKDTRREVFRAISICNKLENKYVDGGVQV